MIHDLFHDPDLKMCLRRSSPTVRIHPTTRDLTARSGAGRLEVMNTPRKISEIAREIEATWPKVNYAAKPYLDAMFLLDTMEDIYYADSASTIVSYFLANASAWRGDDARRIKAELNTLLKGKNR